VAAALRAVGLGEERRFTSYHRVLNRRVWWALMLSRPLLDVLVRTFSEPDAPFGSESVKEHVPDAGYRRPNRLLVQAGDLGHQTRPTVSQPVRLDGGIPPTFGFAESAQQQGHLLVEATVRVVGPDPAQRALADLDVDRAHWQHSSD
jgi:hypothetical protein